MEEGFGEEGLCEEGFGEEGFISTYSLGVANSKFGNAPNKAGYNVVLVMTNGGCAHELLTTCCREGR